MRPKEPAPVRTDTPLRMLALLSLVFLLAVGGCASAPKAPRPVSPDIYIVLNADRRVAEGEEGYEVNILSPTIDGGALTFGVELGNWSEKKICAVIDSVTVDGTEIPLSCSITAGRNTDAYASDRVDEKIVLADHGVDAQTAAGSVTFHVTVYMAPKFSTDGVISGYSDAVEFDFPTELS